MVEHAGLKVFLLLYSGAFNLAFGIAALVVHLAYNAPDPLCSMLSSYLSMSRWLEGFGIANILIFIINIPLIFLLERMALLYTLMTVFIGMFSFAWMIVGSVVLFRDDSSCQTFAYSLWACTMACVIQYYVQMGLNCFITPYIRNTLKKE